MANVYIPDDLWTHMRDILVRTLTLPEHQDDEILMDQARSKADEQMAHAGFMPDSMRDELEAA